MPTKFGISADDSAAGSSLERLKRWWDMLVEIGPLYGFFPNGSKTVFYQSHNTLKLQRRY